MFFSTTAVLALAGFAAAAPTGSPHSRRDICKDEFNPRTGEYQDSGCGVVLYPGNSTVCLSTDWDTVEGSQVYVGGCYSGTEYGGRWALFGPDKETLIENKQAKMNNMCMTSTYDRSGVKMTRCGTQPDQTWVFTDDGRLQLAGTDHCMAVYGDLTDPGKYTRIKADVYLDLCEPGKPNQIFRAGSALQS